MLNNIKFDKRFVNISTTVEINDTTIFVTKMEQKANSQLKSYVCSKKSLSKITYKHLAHAITRQP